MSQRHKIHVEGTMITKLFKTYIPISVRIYLSLIILILPAICLGEEDPERGRLPDGRAFRTDAQGTQLVDYIAELELNIDSLNRQVKGLQEEVEDKERVIARYDSRGEGDSGLVEHDLLAGKQIQVAGHEGNLRKCEPSSACPPCNKTVQGFESVKNDCSSEVQNISQVLTQRELELAEERRSRAQESQDYVSTLAGLRRTAAQTNCPKLSCPQLSCPSSDCSNEESRLNVQLQNLRSELERERSLKERNLAEYESKLITLRQVNDKKSCPKLDCPSVDCSPLVQKAAYSAAEPLRTEIQNCKSELTSLRGLNQRSQSEAQVSQANVRAEYEARLASIQNEHLKSMADTKAALEATKVELRQRNEDIAVLKTDLIKAKSQGLKSQSVAKVSYTAPSSRSSINSTAPKQTYARGLSLSSDSVRASLGREASLQLARDKALQSVRSSMLSDIAEVNRLVRERDKMFKQYNQGGKAVRFKPSALLSGRNNSLGWVTERVKTASSVHELSSYQRDIREIKARVRDDMELMKRFTQ